ncbi:MAG: YncE family protein [Solirubrobacteraceae bacterium]
MAARERLSNSRRRPRSRAAAGLAAAALTVAGCGAAHRPPKLRPAAEPAAAPVAAAAPAGHSTRVGTGPEGIVADGQTGLVAVGVRDPAQLVLLDASSDRVLARISIPGAPRHLQLAGPGGPVFVPEEPADHLLELTLPGRRQRSIRVGAHPHDATADGSRVFVADEFGKSVSVLQGAQVIRTIPGFVQPGGIVGVRSAVAVVDVGADTLTLIDARTLRVIGRLGAGSGPTHVVAGADGMLYVIDTQGGAVLTYATRPKLRRLARFALPGAPYGVAIDPSRGRLWVTLTAHNQLIELGTSAPSLRLVGTYATSRQPNTVAVDQHDGRVFVADASAGTVQMIRPPR